MATQWRRVSRGLAGQHRVSGCIARADRARHLKGNGGYGTDLVTAARDSWRGVVVAATAGLGCNGVSLATALLNGVSMATAIMARDKFDDDEVDDEFDDEIDDDFALVDAMLYLYIHMGSVQGMRLDVAHRRLEATGVAARHTKLKLRKVRFQ